VEEEEDRPGGGDGRDDRRPGSQGRLEEQLLLAKDAGPWRKRANQVRLGRKIKRVGWRKGQRVDGCGWGGGRRR
jgi:hypothetical protein